MRLGQRQKFLVQGDQKIFAVALSSGKRRVHGRWCQTAVFVRHRGGTKPQRLRRCSLWFFPGATSR